MVFSGSGFKQATIALIRGRGVKYCPAPLFVSSAFFSDFVQEAAQIAAHSSGIKKLALIHYSPRYTDYELKKLLEEARAVFPNTVLTRDRMIFPIEYPG
jgi:hypothetical protein